MMSPWLRWRWPIDRVAAALLAIASAPAFAVIGGLIRWQDGGPAFIRLPRVGQNGRHIAVWKVRSMVATTAEGHAAGASITRGDDARVTRIGRHLRRWRLDEFPQLLNIVRGEMALIGPRPEAPDFVDGADARWSRVLRARPGIAGPTQVVVHDWEAALVTESANDSVYEEVILPAKLAVDEWYVARASPWIDCLVVLSLAERFLGGRVVTVLHRRLRRDLPGTMRVIEASDSDLSRLYS